VRHEHADVDVAHELIYGDALYNVPEEDAAMLSNTALSPVPPSVVKEFEKNHTNLLKRN
jgi:hypothetical protein